MQYMIIEKFHEGKVKLVYERFAEKGRMLPDGVEYIDSWINEEVTVCFQLMTADDEKKIKEWIGYWADLADFEIVRVISSSEAKKKALS